MSPKSCLMLTLCCAALLPSGLEASQLAIGPAGAMGGASPIEDCAFGQPGPCGLVIRLTGAANVHLATEEPPAVPGALIGFWVDPATLSIEPGEHVKFLKAFSDAMGGGEHLVVRIKRTNNGQTFKLAAYQKTDAGDRVLVGQVPLRLVTAERDRYIEIAWANSVGGGDGSVEIFRDGESKAQASLPMSAFNIDEVKVGSFGVGQTVAQLPAGTIHVDGFSVAAAPATE